MIRKEDTKNIFFFSLLITCIIFALGILLSFSVDILRYDTVASSIKTHELNRESYLVSKDFVDTFGNESCQALRFQIFDLRKELADVGVDLTAYGTKAQFKKDDFDFLKRRYFLLELNFLSLVEELNAKCEQTHVIIFFYKIDDKVSERQGLVLEDLNEQYNYRLIILSFDKDYEDDAALNVLKHKYKIQNAPALIIDDDVKIEGIHYSGEISPILDNKSKSMRSISKQIPEAYISDSYLY